MKALKKILGRVSVKVCWVGEEEDWRHLGVEGGEGKVGMRGQGSRGSEVRGRYVVSLVPL